MNIQNVILDFAKEIVLEKNFDQLLLKIAQLSKTLADCQRCSIWITDENLLQVKVSINENDESAHSDFDGFVMPIYQGIVGHTVKTVQPIIENNPYESELFNKLVDQETGFKTESIMSIPIVSSNDEVLGAIQVINSNSIKGFSDDDLELLMIAASYAGNTLEALFLEKELKQINAELEDKVQERTQALYELNQNLEIRIEEEVERNLNNSKSTMMGEMIAAIVHQWKQPVSAVKMASGNIRANYEFELLDEQNLYGSLDMIDSQVDYMVKTMNEFSNFLQPSQKELFCVNEMLHSVLSLVGKIFTSCGIEVRIKSDVKIEIMGYSAELEQVVINILNNARDAIKEHKADITHIDLDYFENRNNIHIKISDYAGGIPPHIIHKVFDSYFTTKGKKGTGLGLDICKQILKKVDGEIEVKNEIHRVEDKEYEGATFTIILPRS